MTAYQALVPPRQCLESIGFLLLDDFSLFALAGALEPLRLANQLSGQSLYRWRTLTLDGAPVRAANGMQVAPDDALAEAPDALILCGGDGPGCDVPPRLPERLRELAGQGVHLGALGSASRVLAEAGLLQGYECSPAWACRVELRERFPGIALSSQPYVLDRDRYTAVGGSASLELMLQLIGCNQGPALLGAISETLAFGQLRSEPSPPRLTLASALASAQPKLQEVIALMEANLEEPIDLDELASFIELSRRQLERLFQKYLRCSPSRYYLKLRLLRARQLLRQTALPVVQVAFGCGFLSAQNFSKCYREHFGIPPSNERLDKPRLCRAAMH
ncbi:GlxA family transcriptional regulator [Metapseudomonas resinovorans]|uniref:AraC family transcriptional regulator GbdR n=1 Tax=Metapseudomonas resinovorans NBRC 106553 TaxID=1245471 RepID=S6AQQ1_METRE|nr:GlxA family transcriptional regulator [Pseudomonas resinovorans]BAN46171.1 AraC family transcriptional regulator GbdR [Pseudomonas resinovorans NBRC 106553]